ncbi:DUF4347 domain-containing protein, partial [Synechococcus sp. H55.10]|uniref:DUF4347 domain-containing protein n=1 Tax=Synechococcus sp. H55.10 TaxID=2964503 RepID=UPI0039C65121
MLILLLRVENADSTTSGNILLQHSAQDELVFIDQALPDLSILLAGIRPGTEIILLDPNRDGIQQIAEALRGRKGVRALHVLSHGQAGSIQLGKSLLSLENLSEYASLLSQWKSSLADDAEILIYGCEVASGLEGELLIKQLAHLTGADIAASTNLTGYAGYDADWVLEAATSSIATPTIFVEGSVEHRYQHTLQVGATPTLDANFVLANIQVGTNKLSLIDATNQVILRRVDNDQAAGICNIVWVVPPDTPGSLGITAMEQALLINPINPVIKAGTDNIFTNKDTGTVNLNNIERVDFITPGGITAPSANLDKIGFLLLDRGGNDSFRMAAITKLDPNPVNYIYGSVVAVGSGTWSKGTFINTNVHSDKCGTQPLDTTITSFGLNQPLSGVFVSFQDLGISPSQTFFGYSVVGNDVTGSVKNFNTFSKNTNQINGGWDMTAGGGIVAYNPLANNDAATTPPNTPVTITILSNDVGYVFNLDPSTIDLDPSSPGQQTNLTVPGEGTYTVNLTTGEVTFTPDFSFTGAATPIQYTVKDAQGLISNQATITVTVTPASTPTPTPTPTPAPPPTPRQKHTPRPTHT